MVWRVRDSNSPEAGITESPALPFGEFFKKIELVRDEGFEPQIGDSESPALPLGESRKYLKFNTGALNDTTPVLNFLELFEFNSSSTFLKFFLHLFCFFFFHVFFNSSSVISKSFCFNKSKTSYLSKKFDYRYLLSSC